jgi:hypothetical protein
MKETFSEFFVTILADLFTAIFLTLTCSLMVGLILVVLSAISGSVGPAPIG